MPTYIVLHIPHAPPAAQTRGELGDRVASLPNGASLQLDCIWLVHSESIMADEIRDRLSAGLPAEDALAVFSIGDEAAWRGLTEEQAEWLLERV